MLLITHGQAVIHPLVLAALNGEVFLWLLVVVIAVALVTWMVCAHNTKVNRAWSSAAETMGISHRASGVFSFHLMEGVVAGFHVKVDTDKKSSSGSSGGTSFRISFPASLQLGLSISPEIPWVSKLGKKYFGTQDVTTGDEAFDSIFVIKGNNPEEVLDFLTDQRRQQLVELQGRQKRYDFIHVSDTEISLLSKHILTETTALVELVGDMTRIAFLLADQTVGTSDRH